MTVLLLVSLLSISQFQATSDLISSNTPFTPRATVRLKPDLLCVKIRETLEDFRTAEEKEKLKACVQSKTETGIINGIAYEFFYSDGSGMFVGQRGNSLARRENSNWRVACEKDAITDEKWCYMDRGNARVWVDAQGRSEVYIGDQHYPGSQVVIRIDKGSPLAISSRVFNGSFGYRASPAIIKRIGAAKTVTTRFQRWPHTDTVDDTWEPYGFNEALSYIRWAVRQIK